MFFNNSILQFMWSLPDIASKFGTWLTIINYGLFVVLTIWGFLNFLLPIRIRPLSIPLLGVFITSTVVNIVFFGFNDSTVVGLLYEHIKSLIAKI